MILEEFLIEKPILPNLLSPLKITSSKNFKISYIFILEYFDFWATALSNFKTIIQIQNLSILTEIYEFFFLPILLIYVRLSIDLPSISPLITYFVCIFISNLKSWMNVREIRQTWEDTR